MNNVMRKRYSNDFRDQAVALGRTVPDVALELGIGTSILYRWTQPPSCAASARRTPSFFWKMTF